MKFQHFLLLAAVLFATACFDSGRARDGRPVEANPEISNSTSEISNSESEISNSRSGLSDQKRASSQQLNINTASADDLQRLPHVGPVVAGKIIEHREKFGPFRRVEELMLIDGISDGRFRGIRSFIRVE